MLASWSGPDDAPGVDIVALELQEPPSAPARAKLAIGLLEGCLQIICCSYAVELSSKPPKLLSRQPRGLSHKWLRIRWLAHRRGRRIRTAMRSGFRRPCTRGDTANSIPVPSQPSKNRTHKCDPPLGALPSFMGERGADRPPPFVERPLMISTPGPAPSGADPQDVGREAPPREPTRRPTSSATAPS